MTLSQQLSGQNMIYIVYETFVKIYFTLFSQNILFLICVFLYVFLYLFLYLLFLQTLKGYSFLGQRSCWQVVITERPVRINVWWHVDKMVELPLANLDMNGVLVNEFILVVFLRLRNQLDYTALEIQVVLSLCGLFHNPNSICKMS